MSFSHYKPFVIIEDIHRTILKAINKHIINNVQSKKINEYAYLVVQNSPYKLEKIYLFCLLNEFTEEIYIGFTRNIKKCLKQRTDIRNMLGSDGEVVLHSLFILHIEDRYINNLQKFKNVIEKAFINKRFSVLKKDSHITRKEEIVDKLIHEIASIDSTQSYLNNAADAYLDFTGDNNHPYTDTIEALEEEREASTRKLKSYMDIDIFN